METTNSTPPSNLVTDLSPRVVELARVLDNLPAGVFNITLQKGEIRAQDWKVEIVRAEKIFNMTLSKYNPE